MRSHEPIKHMFHSFPQDPRTPQEQSVPGRRSATSAFGATSAVFGASAARLGPSVSCAPTLCMLLCHSLNLSSSYTRQYIDFVFGILLDFYSYVCQDFRPIGSQFYDIYIYISHFTNPIRIQLSRPLRISSMCLVEKIYNDHSQFGRCG